MDIEAVIRRNARQPKLHLFCPNEECGLTDEVIMGPLEPGGMRRGQHVRHIKRWTCRPEVEAEDDPIIRMSVPRASLYCPDCGTRGYIA